MGEMGKPAHHSMVATPVLTPASGLMNLCHTSFYTEEEKITIAALWTSVLPKLKNKALSLAQSLRLKKTVSCLVVVTAMLKLSSVLSEITILSTKAKLLQPEMC